MVNQVCSDTFGQLWGDSPSSLWLPIGGPPPATPSPADGDGLHTCKLVVLHIRSAQLAFVHSRERSLHQRVKRVGMANDPAHPPHTTPTLFAPSNLLWCRCLSPGPYPGRHSFSWEDFCGGAAAAAHLPPGARDVKDAKHAHSKLLACISEAMGAEGVTSDALAECAGTVYETLSADAAGGIGARREVQERLGPVSDAAFTALCTHASEYTDVNVLLHNGMIDWLGCPVFMHGVRFLFPPLSVVNSHVGWEGGTLYSLFVCGQISCTPPTPALPRPALPNFQTLCHASARSIAW